MDLTPAKNKSFIYTYSDIKFSLLTFLRFIGIKKPNQLQRNKYSAFWKVLPKATHVLQEVDPEQFFSYMVIPYASVSRVRQKLIVSLSVDKRLLSTKFLFAHNNFFRKIRKYDLEVKIMILQSFNSIESFIR